MYEFFKYQGAGNDFVMFDNRTRIIDGSNNKLIEKLCDRKFGVGADGLMLLQSSSDFDFEMKYYNCDGFEASMCGNGARCIVAFANKLGIINEKANFIAADGEHEATLLNNLVSVKMTDIVNIELIDNGYFLNTGVPHYVTFVNNIDAVDVFTEGRKLRFDPKFGKAGANVNFVEIKNNELAIRTYERGVENETLACGTGIVAAAMAFAMKNNLSKTEVQIKARGGDLSVLLERMLNVKAQNVWLTGPAKMVFNGFIEF